MKKTELRSTRGHSFQVTGQLGAMGGQCTGLDLAVRKGGTGTRYVVKWLIKGDKDAVARNEALLAMPALQAIPQVLAPRDIVRDGGRIGIVTPFLESGVTLETLLLNPLSVREHLVVGLQLAHLVALIEGLGLHHGDLSSQNVLVAIVGGVPRVFIIDMDNTTGAGLPPALMMGGEYYAAAERDVAGGQPDGASEAYSLATLLHELLVGAHPMLNDAGLTTEQVRRSAWLYDPRNSNRPAYGWPPEMLHPAVADAFRATLQPDPSLRSPAARWREMLRALVAEGRLAICAVCHRPFYLHSGRLGCPHCGTHFDRAIIAPAGARFVVAQSLVLGRDHCGNPSVSREQLRLTRRGAELLAEAVSTNSPTWASIDGQWRELNAGEPVALPHGAVLRLHSSEFFVE